MRSYDAPNKEMLTILFVSLSSLAAFPLRSWMPWLRWLSFLGLASLAALATFRISLHHSPLKESYFLAPFWPSFLDFFYVASLASTWHGCAFLGFLAVTSLASLVWESLPWPLKNGCSSKCNSMVTNRKQFRVGFSSVAVYTLVAAITINIKPPENSGGQFG